MSRKDTLKIIRIVVIAVVILAIFGYVAFNSRIFVAGPNIKIESPDNGISIGKPLVKIIGKASNISYISIDGRSFAVDESGYFSESLLLSPGYNIIQLTAKDKFNREITESLELVYIGEKPSVESSLEKIEEKEKLELEVSSSTSTASENNENSTSTEESLEEI